MRPWRASQGSRETQGVAPREPHTAAERPTRPRKVLGRPQRAEQGSRETRVVAPRAPREQWPPEVRDAMFRVKEQGVAPCSLVRDMTNVTTNVFYKKFFN